MNLKLIIEIINEDNNERIWADWVTGDSKDKEFDGMFSRAEALLGKMERNLRMVLERDYMENKETSKTCSYPNCGEIATHQFDDESLYGLCDDHYENLALKVG